MRKRTWLRSAVSVSVLAAALGMAGAARAKVPGSVIHQGRLYDDAGAPVSATKLVTFAIYEGTLDDVPIREEKHYITFEDGYFSLSLGTDAPLDAATFDGN